MTVLTQDTMSRANASGSWGTASDGVTVWATAVGSDTPSIVSNEGQLTGAVNRTVQYAGSTTTADIDEFVRWSLSATGDTVTLIARGNTVSTTLYALRYKNGNVDLIKTIGGTTTTLAGPTAVSITGGNFYWFHFRVIGTNLWGNFWADGSPEPQTWLLSVTGDASITGAGRFGVSATLGTSTNTANFDSFAAQDYSNAENLTITDSFTPVASWNAEDDLAGDDSNTTFTQVSTPLESNTVSESATYTDTSSSVQAIGWGCDTFGRANVGAGSWGTATDTETWSVVGTGTATLSVNANEGQAKNGSVTFVALGSRTPSDVELLMRYQLGASADVGGLVSRLNTTNNYYRADIGSGSLRVRKNVSNSFTNLQSVTTTFSVTTGIFIWLRFRTTTNPDTSALLQAKAWQDGTAEPDWQISLIDTSLTGGGNFGILVNPSSATNMLFDSFSAVQYIANDSLPTTDSAAYVEAFVPVEAYPVDDSLTTLTDAYSTVDSLTASDSAAYAYGFVPQEAYPAVDAFTTVDVYLPTEAYVASDAASAFYDVYGPSDTLSASDAGSNIQQYTINFMTAVDALTITDSFTATQTNTSTESLTAADSAAYSATTSPTDALTDSDSASAFTTGYSVTESLSASDSATNFSDVLIAVESLSASDSFTSSDVFGPVESLSASDSTTTFSGNFPSTEALTASDALSVADVLNATEPLAVSDSATTFSNAYVPQEVLSVSESLLASDGAVWVDALTASDAGSALIQIIFNLMSAVDALTASDSFSTQLTLNGVESYPVADSFTGYSVYGPVEALSGLDVFAVVTSASLLESVPVSDVGVCTGGFRPSDNLSASDSAGYAVVLVPVEALSVSDALLATDTPGWVDGLTVLESVAYVSVLVPVEALSALDSLVATGGALFADVAVVGDTGGGTAVYVPLEALAASDSFAYVDVIVLPAVQTVSVRFRFRDGHVVFRVR